LTLEDYTKQIQNFANRNAGVTPAPCSNQKDNSGRFVRGKVRLVGTDEFGHDLKWRFMNRGMPIPLLGELQPRHLGTVVGPAFRDGNTGAHVRGGKFEAFLRDNPSALNDRCEYNSASAESRFPTDVNIWSSMNRGDAYSGPLQVGTDGRAIVFLLDFFENTMHHKLRRTNNSTPHMTVLFDRGDGFSDDQVASVNQFCWKWMRERGVKHLDLEIEEVWGAESNFVSGTAVELRSAVKQQFEVKFSCEPVDEFRDQPHVRLREPASPRARGAVDAAWRGA
jgi:hypothetical protein